MDEKENEGVEYRQLLRSLVVVVWKWAIVGERMRSKLEALKDWVILKHVCQRKFK